MKTKIQQPNDDERGYRKDNSEAATNTSRPTGHCPQMPPTPPPDDPHRNWDIEPVHPLRLASNHLASSPQLFVSLIPIDHLQTSPDVSSAPMSPQEARGTAHRRPRRAIQEAVEAATRQRSPSETRKSSSSSANSTTNARPVLRQHQPPRAKYSLIPRISPTREPTSRNALPVKAAARPIVSAPIPISTLPSPTRSSTSSPGFYSSPPSSRQNEIPSPARSSSSVSSTTSNDRRRPPFAMW